VVADVNVMGILIVSVNCRGPSVIPRTCRVRFGGNDGHAGRAEALLGAPGEISRRRVIATSASPTTDDGPEDVRSSR
jgi:hypothetical protein